MRGSLDVGRLGRESLLTINGLDGLATPAGITAEVGAGDVEDIGFFILFAAHRHGLELSGLARLEALGELQLGRSASATPRANGGGIVFGAAAGVMSGLDFAHIAALVAVVAVIPHRVAELLPSILWIAVAAFAGV